MTSSLILSYIHSLFILDLIFLPRCCQLEDDCADEMTSTSTLVLRLPRTLRTRPLAPMSSDRCEPNSKLRTITSNTTATKVATIGSSLLHHFSTSFLENILTDQFQNHSVRFIRFYRFGMASELGVKSKARLQLNNKMKAKWNGSYLWRMGSGLCHASLT